MWFDETTAPCLDDLQCGNCASTENIALVAQIYTPMDGLDRSLYIFCCNTRKCSLLSSGWRVIRNQKSKAKAGSTKGPPLAPPSKIDSAPIVKGPSEWSFLSDEGKDEKSKLASANDKDNKNKAKVEEEEEEEEDDMEEFLALLAQRDKKLQERETPKQKQTTTSVSTVAATSLPAVPPSSLGKVKF